MNSILFENVTKLFGKNVIVKELNMEIHEGERLILLGPSGCGKSTTLRMIAGLEKVTSGNLFMGGSVVNEVPCGERGVSMVFQNYALFPHMTVRQNITYGLKANKVDAKEIEKRFEEVIKMLELGGLEERKPRELSGGQRQRVALARAVVKQSDYFLLDEPLSNLDAQLRQRARKKLVGIHEAYHQTLVYVTHDQIEAMTVGQRVAVMYRGKIEMIDTPGNVYNRPASVFCARFIGSPAMNIMDVTYREGKLCMGRQSLQLPDMWSRLAEANKSRELYFGIRPEHVVLTREKKEHSLEGVVKYIEDYGNGYGVYVRLAGREDELTALTEGNVPAPGETVYINVGFEHIHLFDRESEKSIGYPKEMENIRYGIPDSFQKQGA